MTNPERAGAIVDNHAHIFTRDLPLAPNRRYVPDIDALPDPRSPENQRLLGDMAELDWHVQVHIEGPPPGWPRTTQMPPPAGNGSAVPPGSPRR